MAGVNDPVPASWTTTTDTFACFWVCQTTHAADTFYVSPDSRLADGKFRILLARSSAGRANLVRSFLSFEDGSHVKQSWVEIVECTAFRLEPQTTNSHVALDGEEIEYGVVQAKVEPSATNVYA